MASFFFIPCKYRKPKKENRFILTKFMFCQNKTVNMF